MGLRIRRADSSPGVGPEEYFGRLPESAIRDTRLSPEAKVLLASIYLSIATERTGPFCLATTAALARVIDRTERHAYRLLEELERTGHVARERVRTMPGSPRGIRPLAKLRGVRAGGVGQPSNMTSASGCNLTSPSGSPDIDVSPPCHDRQGTLTVVSVPLKRREEEKNPEDRPADGDKGQGRPSPPPSEAPESPEDLDELERLASLKGPMGVMARARLSQLASKDAAPAQGKAPGSSAKIPPGPHARDSAPNTSNCTQDDGQPSRSEDAIEHNAQT